MKKKSEKTLYEKICQNKNVYKLVLIELITTILFFVFIISLLLIDIFKNPIVNNLPLGSIKIVVSLIFLFFIIFEIIFINNLKKAQIKVQKNQKNK